MTTKTPIPLATSGIFQYDKESYTRQQELPSRKNSLVLKDPANDRSMCTMVDAEAESFFHPSNQFHVLLVCCGFCRIKHQCNMADLTVSKSSVTQWL